MKNSLRAARPWILWSALAIPAGTLLHEGMHYVAYQLSGVHEVAIHFNTVDGANAAHPAWALAVPALAGPLMTLLILGVCCLFAKRSENAAFAAAGLVTPWRFIAPGFWLVIHTLFGKANDANFDELNAMRALNWPRQPIMLLEIALVAVALAYLARSVPRERRGVAMLASAVGGGAGIAFWWTVGPLVLP